MAGESRSCKTCGEEIKNPREGQTQCDDCLKAAQRMWREYEAEQKKLSAEKQRRKEILESGCMGELFAVARICKRLGWDYGTFQRLPRIQQLNLIEEDKKYAKHAGERAYNHRAKREIYIESGHRKVHTTPRHSGDF